MLYNPLKEKITRTIKVPLYYTSLNSVASVSEKDKPAKTYQINRDHTIDLSFTIEAEGFTWFTIE